MEVNVDDMKWTRKPALCSVSAGRVEIITEPHTDLWQRTYYHFRNDNAPLFQLTSGERFFSFVVRAEFDSKVRYDQAGIVLYMDSDNWLKASVEYENERIQRLGSVVTNNGYSDWASMDIDASVKSMWFRLSRRENDFCIENSADGKLFSQMRICHLFAVTDVMHFGLYACSAEDSSFKATFTNMELTECKWATHNGQAPDEELS